jgi:hypothetical protein
LVGGMQLEAGPSVEMQDPTWKLAEAKTGQECGRAHA